METPPAAAARCVQEAGLAGARMVVAVSGGPDSLALLHALRAIAEAHTLTLHVAHVDHGLRATSSQDAAAVRRHAEALGLPCTVAAVRVPQRPDGAFAEAAARDARYRALADIAAVEGAAVIATGHTLDDQAETALLHAVRGAGLHGLRAMALLSDIPIPDAPVRIFRPLLGLRRTETVDYCRQLGVTPLEDESNRDPRMARNLLRLEALPLLERLNPQVAPALARLAEAAGAADDYLEAALAAEWPTLATACGEGIAVDRGRLAALHPALRPLAVRRAHRQACAADAALDATHIAACLELAEGPAGREAALPGGVRAEARHAALLFVPADAAPPPMPLGERPLGVPGAVVVGGWRVEACAASMPTSLGGEPSTAHLDADALGGELAVRGRRPGDRFQPLGMARGSRVLQDVLVDAHVPRRERDALPLLVTPRGIAWVAGHAVAHWARVTPATRRILRVSCWRVGGGAAATPETAGSPPGPGPSD